MYSYTGLKALTITLLFLSVCGHCVRGQTEIFKEDFLDEPNGSTMGTDQYGNSWSLDCPYCQAADIFEVSNVDLDGDGNPLTGVHGNDTNGEAFMRASGIDLSSSDCAFVRFSLVFESDSYAGPSNLECASECTGGGFSVPNCQQTSVDCVGDVDDPLADGCCNCWDFLYAEIKNNISGETVREILLGDNCNEDGGRRVVVSEALCVSQAGDMGELNNVDLGIVMSMWGSEEDMVFGDVIVECFTIDEAIDAGIDTVGCRLLSQAELTLAVERVQSDRALLEFSYPSGISDLELQRHQLGSPWKSIGEWKTPEQVLPTQYGDSHLPSGDLYYRLIGYDQDGMPYFSPVVKLVSSQVDEIQIDVAGQRIIVSSDQHRGAQIDLIDFQGRILRNWICNERRCEFSVSHLPSGTYIVRSTDLNGSIELTKLVIP